MPAPDNAPTGSFKLDTAALWIGQSVNLTQVRIADDGVNDPATVTRVVSWGDGTTTGLPQGVTPVPHQYNRAGRFPITLTLTDPAGHQAVVKSAGPNVTVPAFKYKVSATTVWPGQIFTRTISNVPAGTTKITVDDGDGYVFDLPGKNQTTKIRYYHRKNGGLIRGAVTIRVAFTNTFGRSAWINAARVIVKTDSWSPTVSISKPSHANRASSWNVVRGTAADKGAGIGAVFVFVARVTNGTAYCYKAGWHLIHDQDSYDKYCIAIPVATVNGKWSLKLGGVKKGTLYVDAVAFDWADHQSKFANVKVAITG